MIKDIPTLISPKDSKALESPISEDEIKRPYGPFIQIKPLGHMDLQYDSIGCVGI